MADDRWRDDDDYGRQGGWRDEGADDFRRPYRGAEMGRGGAPGRNYGESDFGRGSYGRGSEGRDRVYAPSGGYGDWGRSDERSSGYGGGNRGRAYEGQSGGGWGNDPERGYAGGGAGRTGAYGREGGYGGSQGRQGLGGYSEQRGGQAAWSGGNDYGGSYRGSSRRSYGGEGDWDAAGGYGDNLSRGQRGYGRGSTEFAGDYSRGGYGDEERGFWDKATDEVSSWFGDEEAARRRHMDELRSRGAGRGPRGYTRSDERIREDVCDRLSNHSWVDASDVEVMVASGEVTLSGTVNSRESRRRIEDIADSVSGVSHVQNNLRVNRGTFHEGSSVVGAGASGAVVAGTGPTGSAVAGGSSGGGAGSAGSAASAGSTTTSVGGRGGGKT